MEDSRPEEGTGKEEQNEPGRTQGVNATVSGRLEGGQEKQGEDSGGRDQDICFSDLWAENRTLLGPTDLDIYNSTDVGGINHSRKGIVIYGKDF